MTLDSMKEWLDHWSDGTNWNDASGATVPTVKSDLRKLLDDATRMRDALRSLQERALNKAIGSASEFGPATAASIAIICEDALEGV